MDTPNITMLLQRTAKLEKELAAKNRELQIEGALEWVRARTMAMQKSNELTEVAGLLFTQLSALGVKTWTAGFNVWSEDNNSYVDYITSPNGGFIEPYTVYTDTAEALTDISNARKSGVEFDVQYVEGEKIKQLYLALSKLDEKMYEKMLQDGVGFPSHQYEHFVFGSKVSLMFITYEPAPEAHNLFKRFGKVFEQTYTRFLDLQKAEAQAREATIEAALERVRSRSMAMHKSEEVMDVAVSLYDELQKLDFTFGATSAATIIIMDEKTGHMEHWLAGFIQKNHVESYEVNNIEYPIHTAQLAAWRAGAKFISLEMSGTALKAYAKEMFTKTGYRNLPDEEKAMLSAQEHVVFNMAYMSHGALMWAPSALSDENAIILQRFAKVFEQTYTRFLDLKKAEAHTIRAEQDLIEIKAARKKAEDTLAALKATQLQLIQAEKMASLGELTAGIAHEIQNPLNFVNNFSETNTELLHEAKTEFMAGNNEEGFAILNDIEENEQKINHHGRRADSIVKGMLEHSRTTKGERQLADINALADEYLRLSYHGLRAKDKSFNAKVETSFDESSGKINVVPQDIGRVLLNIFNNAFYAVNEKKKQTGEGYEPTVTVSTKKLNSNIEIKVSDNGSGISQNLIDKIFQPFFTTKPTGQGTGLGLSLSYDIIKAHSGELKVESTEGEGATFIIQLPVS